MSREDVLNLLKPGKVVSGEEISRQLGLSRTAIWKTVDQLRQEGYEITARTGLGYRLVRTPDLLTEREIRRFLREIRRVGRELVCFDEIDSTNTFAKKLAMDGPHDGAVIVANCQTAGRGRMDRVFQSPRDKGIYLSVLMRPTIAPNRLMACTAMAGVAVCAAVERICGVRPGLKWPNDPVLNGKKVAGILTELSLEGESSYTNALTVGIGINVSQKPEDFSPEVAAIATSLAEETGQEISRPRLAAALIEELDAACAAMEENRLQEYLDAFRRDCVTLGREVRLEYPESDEIVTAVDIDSCFGLIVRDSAGKETVVRAGEVSVRGLYGYINGEADT